MAYALRRRGEAERGRVRLDARPITSLRDPWILYCVSVLVLGATLRALALARPALGYDEAGYALDAWRLLTGQSGVGRYFESAPGYVQLLSLATFLFGARDSSIRLLSLLCGAGTVLLCAPLSRLVGRGPAGVAALLFAVSPLWLRTSFAVAPDGAAVFLAVFGAALVASYHKWPWSLMGGAVLAGLLLAFGAPGLWLSAGLLALLIWVPRRYWNAGRAATAVTAFGLAALAGLSAFFSEPLRLPVGLAALGPYATGLQIGREALLSTPAYVLLLSAVALVLFSSRRAIDLSCREDRALLFLSAALSAPVAGLLLPTAIRPSPAVLAAPVTFLAACLVVRALSALVRPGRVMLVAGSVVLVAAAIGALATRGSAPMVYVPGGVSAAVPPGSAVTDAMSRLRRVSLDLYSLDRSLAEPRGGRGLRVSLQPALANWGQWYLRDFQNVEVSPAAAPEAEVRVLTGHRSRRLSGWMQERFRAQRSTEGASGQTVILAWRNKTWAQINPVAGSNLPKPKSVYGLLDAAPPGGRPGQLNTPSDIALSPDGNYYVVDQGNSRVEKYAPNGRFLLKWGSKGSGDGELGDLGPMLGPTGILATREYVWVADTWNHRIEQFRPDGAFVRAWGAYVDTHGAPATNARNPNVFYGPRGLALGPDHLLYITDTGNKRVVVYTQDGRFVRQWGSVGKGRSQLDEPVGIAVDRAGRVYVADGRNARIQVFSSAGRPIRSWHVKAFAAEGRLEPYLDVDAKGNLYVTEPATGTVAKYSSKGHLLTEYLGDEDAELLTPIGLAVKPDGEVYIVDSGLGRVLHLRALQ